MTRQYIGARYVPRFTGLHDPTQSYEALDVVDNGSGTSYIAKIPTPANTPLTDTNYWFLYGSTSGAIVNLQQQINDMKDGDVPGSLQDQIDTNTSDITALTNKTTGGFCTLKNRKFIFVGDSYAQGTHGATGWIDLVNSKLGLTRGENSFDSREVSVYYGGSFGAGTFLTQINDCLSLIDNANDITDIYVFAGQNEPSNTDAQTATGIDNFCARAKEIYPNAVVHIGFVGLAKPSNYENMLAKLIQYINGSGRNGADYVTNIECVNRRYSDVNSDGIHPNSYNELASYIASAILNGNVDVVRYAEYTSVSPITGEIPTFNLSVYQYNHSIKIKVNFVLTNFSTIPSNEYINCANLPIIDFVCVPAYTSAPFNNNNANPSTKYETNCLLVKINPSTNKLQIRNTQLDASGWVDAPAPIRLSSFDTVHIESTCFA